MAIPDAIAGAPQLRVDLRWVWEAFSDLTTERAPSGMGPPGRIPWTAMHHYCGAKRIRGDDEDWFVHLIKEMDDTYLAHLNREYEKQNPPPPDRNPTGDDA